MTDNYEVLFRQVWDEQVHETKEDKRNRGYKPERWYTSGRSSKAHPNKEDESWWFEKGPGFIKSWVNWRNASGLTFWTAPDEEPGIELPVEATRKDGLKVLSVIDRVMENADGELFIVDLKSGSQTPAWPRQLALNNLGLYYTYGVWAEKGGFWNARKGGVATWYDLSVYTEDWLWGQIWRAREIRDLGLFVAQPGNLCNSACGCATTVQRSMVCYLLR